MTAAATTDGPPVKQQQGASSATLVWPVVTFRAAGGEREFDRVFDRSSPYVYPSA